MTRAQILTPADLRAVHDRYIATGERPAAIAAALGLDEAEVAAAFAPAPAAAPVKPARKARPRKPPAAAPAPTKPAAETFDAADYAAKRNGGPSVTSHGQGYATIRTGGRRVF
jgi:hypothetical protein